jgi:biotin transport system substrate-specific component
VGGLLGPALGASSLVLYLLLGAAGLSVFTPFGLPGVARLIGPTGGYLLAYPLAAAIVGRLASDSGRQPGVSRWVRPFFASLAGLVVIHLGGLAQLVLITGSGAAAVQLGTVPFLLSDIGKLSIAVLILRPFVSPLRARL